MQVGDKVYLRRGLERHDARAFTVVETTVEHGIELVKIDYPGADGWWETGFFGDTPSPEAGRAQELIQNEPIADPNSGDDLSRQLFEIDELLTIAVAAFVSGEDRSAIDSITRAVERLRGARELVDSGRLRP